MEIKERRAKGHQSTIENSIRSKNVGGYLTVFNRKQLHWEVFGNNLFFFRLSGDCALSTEFRALNVAPFSDFLRIFIQFGSCDVVGWVSVCLTEVLGSVSSLLQNPGVKCYTEHFGWSINSLVFPALPRPWQMENSESRTPQSVQSLSQRALLPASWTLPDENCNSFILRCRQLKGHVLGPAFLPHSQPYQLLLPINKYPSESAGIHCMIGLLFHELLMIWSLVLSTIQVK